MSMMPRRALVAALLLSVAGLQACDACSGKKAEPSAKADAKKSKKKGKKKKKKKAKPKVSSGHAPGSGASVAIQAGDRAILWTEGRTSALGRKITDLSWSADGFQWAAHSGTQVLAPGGALYWQAAPSADAKPLPGLMATPGPVPEGYEVKAGAGRGGQYKLTVHAPGERVFRLGMARDAPSATAWFDGKLPPGVRATAKLDKTVTWARDDKGQLTHARPAGLTVAEATAASAEKQAAWLPSLQKIAGPDAALVSTQAFELDGDPAVETLVCLSGAKGDYSCFLVDEVNGNARFHGVGIPWTGGEAASGPLASKQGDNPYFVWVGPPSRSKGASDNIAHVLYFDGGAFQIDLIR
jgi:hypothetical protein